MYAQESMHYNQRPEFLKANRVWPFGDSAGVDFTNGSPATFLTSINTLEGCASVCDTATGALLFYAGGGNCYNRNHEIMLNGDTIIDGGGTTSQGDCIVPVLDSPGKFYLFSLNYQASKPSFHYSVIDMNLDNGLGGIIPGRKNLLLDTNSLSEAMIAIPGDNCDVWVITHVFMEPVFKAWHITKAGLDPDPVISTTGSQISGWFSYFLGQMAVSPNRNMLVMNSGSGFPFFVGDPQTSYGVMLCKFDPATGLVSDGQRISTMPSYGACFSPDNTKLYAGQGYLNQYDVSTFSSGGTVPPPVFVANGTLAPRLYNDTIYYPKTGWWANALSRITDPNITGTDCNVESAFLYVQPGTNIGASFPNEAIYPLPPDTLGVKMLDTLVCINGAPGFEIHAVATPGYAGYVWHDGMTDSTRDITERGTYWVLCVDECHSRVDTFIVGGADAALELGPDTTLCSRSSYTLDAGVSGTATYSWNTGSDGETITATTDGLYRVEVYKSGCVFEDSVRLDFINVRQDLGPDTVICRGEAIRLVLTAQTPDGGDILWNSGGTDTNLYVRDTGTYWVSVSQAPCVGSDTMRVSWKLCDCTVQVPNAFSPNGDGLNDKFLPVPEAGCQVLGYSMQVFNRWGQLVYQSPVGAEGIGEGWDGFIKGMPAALDTYMYRIWLEVGTEHYIQEKRGDITLIR